MSITYPLPTSSPRTVRRGSFHAGRGEVRFKSPYANNAVTSITHSNSSGTQIVKHSYAYDSTNNIVEYLNSLDGNTTYDYDFLGQLISADYANATITDESYSYDSNGNRLTANGDEYTTGANNELTSDSNWTYTYDDEGNRISKQNSTNRELYEWDYRNRLTKVTQQTYNAETETWTTTQTIEYAYDYNNVWIRKIIGNEKTIFIPENYQTTVQIDNGTVIHHYLWTPNQQDKLLADTTSSDVLWSLTDHLGTIRDVIGNSTTHLIYDAFGNLVSGTNPILFAYTGKAFDVSTQLQNNINRWYDATTGRWLSQDPIDFYGCDINLYRYVGNSITNHLDVDGLITYGSLPDAFGITPEFVLGVYTKEEGMNIHSLDILNAQLSEWEKDDDYHFAAIMLRAFLEQSEIYTPENPLDLSNNSSVIQTIQNNQKYQTTLKDNVKSLILNGLETGETTWIGQKGEFAIRYNPKVPLPFFASYDGPLGMALGGVRFKYTIIGVSASRPTEIYNKFFSCYYDRELQIKIKVTYTDTYSFVGSGIYEAISRRYPVYYAGYWLEMHGYHSVSSTATWNEKFSFTITYKINSNQKSSFYELKDR